MSGLVIMVDGRPRSLTSSRVRVEEILAMEGLSAHDYDLYTLDRETGRARFHKGTIAVRDGEHFYTAAVRATTA